MLILGDAIFALILGLLNGLFTLLGDPSKKQHNTISNGTEGTLN